MEQTRTVLIIEHDQAAADSLAALCRQLGLQPFVAHDSATGLSLAARERPRVILSDLAVPGLDGFEIARRVRSDHTLDGTTVIAVTEHAPKAAAANQVTFDDYVLKPVSLDNVQQVIGKYVTLS